jgi:hypothetical protein
MNIFGQLVGFDKDQIRFDRIKDILNNPVKNNQVEEEEMKDDGSKMDKDDSKFIQLHFQNS